MTTPVKKVPIHLQSAQNRLLIKNGIVVNDDGMEQTDVYVEDAMIKQMGNHLIIPGGTRVVDATGKYIVPGGIDANVHLQMPVKTGGTATQTIDDFYQGTKAAIAGGTTLVVDCVKPEKGESLIEAYNKWRGWADEMVCCDYALRVQVPEVSQSTKQEMEELTADDFGVNTFFVTMEGPNKLADSDLLSAFETCAKLGCMAQVLAESGEIIERNEKKMLESGVTGPEGFALAHSEEAEEEATMRATALANQVNCPLYVTSVSSASATDIIRSKKAKGNVVYAEVTPAALACDGQEYWNQCWSHAAAYVCSPPLRKGQADKIVEATATDETGMDVVASNHATFNKKQKALGVHDFTKIPIGLNGIGERMSVLWEKVVHSGKCGPERFVALTSAEPAKIFNLYPDKGRIEVGSHADLVIWDPSATKTISTASHNLKTDFNVFDGMECHGVPETVIVQGRIVVDEGQLRVMQGFGRFLPLPPFAPTVYEKVRAHEAAAASTTAVIRSPVDLVSNGSGDIPPPTPVKSDQAERAPSQQESSFDLRSHPNEPENETATQESPQVASTFVRVRAPPGGRSSGAFW